MLNILTKLLCDYMPLKLMFTVSKKTKNKKQRNTDSLRFSLYRLYAVTLSISTIFHGEVWHTFSIQRNHCHILKLCLQDPSGSILKFTYFESSTNMPEFSLKSGDAFTNSIDIFKRSKIQL